MAPTGGGMVRDSYNRPSISECCPRSHSSYAREYYDGQRTNGRRRNTLIRSLVFK
jgi:hypothetical protein